MPQTISRWHIHTIRAVYIKCILTDGLIDRLAEVDWLTWGDASGGTLIKPADLVNWLRHEIQSQLEGEDELDEVKACLTKALRAQKEKVLIYLES